MSTPHKLQRSNGGCHDCTRRAVPNRTRCVGCARKHKVRQSVASRGKGPLAVCEENRNRFMRIVPPTQIKTTADVRHIEPRRAMAKRVMPPGPREGLDDKERAIPAASVMKPSEVRVVGESWRML